MIVDVLELAWTIVRAKGLAEIVKSEVPAITRIVPCIGTG